MTKKKISEVEVVEKNESVKEVQADKASNTKQEVKQTKTKPKKKKLTLADVPLNTLAEVQSCFGGKLTYVSKRTGYKVVWHEFGTVEYLSVDELLAMRNSQPGFFKKQWIRIIGENADDIISFLQLEKYYQNDYPFEDYEEIIGFTPNKIEEVVATFSDSIKESFARYVYTLIQNGEIDSIKKIEAIEKATGFQLRD